MNSIDNVIIVLGNTNNLNETLSNIALARAKAAATLYNSWKGEVSRFLFTGGISKGQTSIHARQMRQHMIEEYSVPLEAMLDEYVDSQNTQDDAELAKKVVEAYEPKRVYVVTSRFHIPRAMAIFWKVFGEEEYKYKLIGYSAPNAASREEQLVLNERDIGQIVKFHPDRLYRERLSQEQLACLPNLWQR